MVLDPPNKMQFAVWMFTKYYGEVDALVARLKSIMLRLYNKYKLQEKQIDSNLLKNI